MTNVYADVILLLHVIYVTFVILGLLLVYVGKFLNWRWVRNPWFRLIHLLAITVVVVQSWLGVVCPLTNLEMALRSQAAGEVYAGAFIAHWLETLLYYQASPWVFLVCYTVFAIIAAASWFWVRPRSFY